jgi:hypothetical protein
MGREASPPVGRAQGELMRAMSGVLAAAGALVLLAMAGTADAQAVRTRQGPQPQAPSQFSVSSSGQTGQPNQISPQSRRSTLRWDSVRGRWGLQVDMDQTAQRDMAWGDVQAGAYYSITRALRVGGAVSLGDTSPQLRTGPVPQAPRVRLETAFRF